MAWDERRAPGYAPRRPHVKNALEVAAVGLLALDRLEQRLEVPLAERLAATTLDDLEEERRTVLDRLGEDLKHIALVVLVDQDVELLELLDRLGDLADALDQIVVV